MNFLIGCFARHKYHEERNHRTVSIIIILSLKIFLMGPDVIRFRLFCQTFSPFFSFSLFATVASASGVTVNFIGRLKHLELNFYLVLFMNLF